MIFSLIILLDLISSDHVSPKRVPIGEQDRSLRL